MSLIEDIKNGKIDEVDLLDYVIDPDDAVNLACAESLYSPAEILDIAARNDNVRVRLAVAENPNTGTDTLQYLLNDDSSVVAEAARTHMQERRQK